MCLSILLCVHVHAPSVCPYCILLHFFTVLTCLTEFSPVCTD
jgi:hypothetical protein